MLSIHWLQDPEYYLDQASADYYFKGGEPQGEWYGEGAEALQLGETVLPHDLRNLFKGYSPIGKPLVQNAGDIKHQAAWDLTFSAPKSFSVLWSGASDELKRQLIGIHERAVKAALDYVQDVAAYTRRGKGGKILERAKLVTALFRHSVSRELDPQVHTHAVLLNVAAREDKTTGTIISRTIYDHKMTAGAMYQAALASGLREELGLTVTRTKASFEIDGIPESLVLEQSKRRAAIQELLKSKGFHSAKAAEVATLATRSPKEVPPRTELFPRWEQTNSEHGFTQARIDSLLGQAKKINEEQLLKTAVETAIQNVSEKQSHFAEQEVLREALKLSLEPGLRPETVKKAVHDAITTDLVSLGRRNGYLRYATQEQLTIEKKLVSAIERLANETGHVASAKVIERTLEQKVPLHENLSDSDRTRNIEQRHAVETLTGARGDIQFLSGMAGTGKTYTLGVCRDIWEKEGFEVKGLTLAGAAARRLEEESGIKSETVELFLTKLSHATEVHSLFGGKSDFVSKSNKAETTERAELHHKTILVVDEAPMVGTKQFRALLEAVEKTGAKLVAVGDLRQIQSVEAGGAVIAVKEIAPTAELKHITRQKIESTDPNPTWQRKAVEHFADGNSVDGLLLAAERGKVSVLKDRQQAMEVLVKDWATKSITTPKEHLILAGTNAEVKELNDLCQESRRREGCLGTKNIKVADEMIHVKDRVLITERSRALAVENGDFGTVSDIHRIKKVVTVELDRGGSIEIPTATFQSIQRGYAATTHKAQGATVDRTSVLVGGSMQDLHMSYVQLSRHREECHLYTDRFEAGRLLEGLAIQMGRRNEKDLALHVLRDFVTTDNSDKPKLSEIEIVTVKSDAPYFRDEYEEVQQLQLEKLERLRTVMEDPPSEVPQTKSKPEMKQLLAELREKAETAQRERVIAELRSEQRHQMQPTPERPHDVRGPVH